MRQSPGRLMTDALVIPVGVLAAEVAENHLPGAGVHGAGNTETLSGLGSKGLDHRVIHDLNDEASNGLSGGFIALLYLWVESHGKSAWG